MCSSPKDGSPAKKVAESKPEEQPATDAMAVVEETGVEEKKEDPAAESKPSDPAAEPVLEEKVEKMVETAVEAAAGAAADPVATQ